MGTENALTLSQSFEAYWNAIILALLVVKIFIDVLRLYKDRIPGKLDDKAVVAYDRLSEAYAGLKAILAKEEFRKKIKAVWEIVEAMYLQGTIKKDERLEAFNRILKERVGNGTVDSLPKDWKEIAVEIAEQLCVDDKLQRLKAAAASARGGKS